jgi:eukaryotic-like serine/threonine-protein kinase
VSLPPSPGTALPTRPSLAARDLCYRFGPVSFDARTLELRVHGEPVRLEPKPLDLLLFLLQHAGEVVTKEELQNGVWPGRILSESVLTKAMARLRQGLGDDDQQLIKTVHGYGYRLVAPVTLEAPAALTPQASPVLALQPDDSPPLRPLWRLEAPLGRGRAGEAWRAVQEKTGERRVFKFALDGPGLTALKREITLFRLLRQVHGPREDLLPLLDWNLDVAPYFIETEHVPGGSLVDWVSACGGLAAQPLAERIDWAIQTAEALAAAHAAGILHKDLKPSNLLVAEAGGRRWIKLADFGSGGLLDRARIEALAITRMGFTQTGISDPDEGTLLYLAPERLAGQAPTVQSDLYALGVLLWQLAVGDLRRPLAPGWEAEIHDPLLREDIALAAAGDPARRLLEASELARRLRRLPERRAAAAGAAAAEAEAAGLRQALERSRARRGVMRALVAALVVGLGLSTWGFWSARAAQQQLAAAVAEARATVTFLSEDVLAAADPFGAGRPMQRLQDLLDEAAPRLAERLAAYPVARAEMGYAIARAYEGQGAWARAQAQLETARAEAEAALGPEADLSLAITEHLAYVLMLQGEYEASEQLSLEVYERRRRRDGDPHPNTLSSRDALAWLAYERGRFDLAAEQYEALLPLLEGPDLARARTSARWSLAECYLELNRAAEAERLMRSVIAETTALQGAEHPRTYWQHATLGDALLMQARWDEAAVVFDRAHAGLEATVGELHPYTLILLHYRGQLLLERGDPVAALPLLRRAYDGRVTVQGEDHPWTRFSVNRVAQAMTQLGLVDEAIALLEPALAQAEAAQGVGHPNVILLQVSLADALIAANRLAAAEVLLQAALQAAPAGLPAGNVRYGYLQRSLAELRDRQGRATDAATAREDARRRLAMALGEHHPQVQALAVR